jgi:hypothetical protein
MKYIKTRFSKPINAVYQLTQLPEFALLDEIDRYRLIVIYSTQKRLNRPIPCHESYLSQLGFNLQNKPLNASLEALNSLLEYVSEANEIKPTNLQADTTYFEKTKLTEMFEKIWARYPRQEGKKAAFKHFCTSVKNNDNWNDIKLALHNYKTYLHMNHIEEQFTKMGSTWFNSWQEWTHKEIRNKWDSSVNNFREAING